MHAHHNHYQYLTRLLIVFSDLDEAEVHLPWARALARSLHLPMTLVYLVDESSLTESREITQPVAEDALLLLASDARLAGFEVTTESRIGAVQTELAALAANLPGEIVVLASRGPATERTTLGLPTAEVTRILGVPYLLIPSDATAPTTINRIVVGNDRSELAESVLRVAHTVGHALDVNVIEVEAFEPFERNANDYREIAPLISARDVRLRGRAGRTILTTARARDAAVIIVGARGIGASADPRRGSTSEWLVQHTDRPVLIVPAVREA
jgi:nucleotide-binding universal stress UspA family protein